MDLNTITIADFKTFFKRDFPFAPNANTTDPDYVLDSDITRAFSEAKININQSIFPGDDAIKIGYLYLSAHFLYSALFSGMSGGGIIGIVASKSAGNVSETYKIPEAFINDPILGLYYKTNYGQRYLAYIAPYLVGNIGTAFGTSVP